MASESIHAPKVNTEVQLLSHPLISFSSSQNKFSLFPDKLMVSPQQQKKDFSQKKDKDWHQPVSLSHK